MAVDVLAPLAVINAIAITHSQTLLGAVPPDGVLDEARKPLGEGPIKPPGINPVRDPPQDVGAIARAIALAIGVLSSQTP